MDSYEKTVRWIASEIRRYDLETSTTEMKPGERSIATMDLLSTIKLVCDMETGDIENEQKRWEA